MAVVSRKAANTRVRRDDFADGLNYGGDRLGLEPDDVAVDGVIADKGNPIGRVEAGQVGFKFSQNDLCNVRQVKVSHGFQRDPVQMREFVFGSGKVVRVAEEVRGIGKKEAGIKAPRTARRRDSAEEEAEGGRVWRMVAICESCPLLGCRPALAACQAEAGFFPDFPDGGGGDGLGCAVRAVGRKPRHADGLWCRGQRYLAIIPIDASSWKNEFLGHERGCLTALSHEDGRIFGSVSNQDDSGRIVNCDVCSARVLRNHKVALPIASRRSCP